jgi:hypothetical protein
MKYQVIVSNVGTVYDGNSYQEAIDVYGNYIGQSQAGLGRVGGENVTIVDSGEITVEHFGDVNND